MSFRKIPLPEKGSIGSYTLFWCVVIVMVALGTIIMVISLWHDESEWARINIDHQCYLINETPPVLQFVPVVGFHNQLTQRLVVLKARTQTYECYKDGTVTYYTTQ